MNSYWILEDIKGSNIKIIRIIHSRRFDVRSSSTSPRLLPSVVCKDWYFWASGWAIIIQFITKSRKVCLLLLLLIFEQRDRPFWAVCHFLVLTGFQVVIWIYAWERIRSARDVLPSWSETTRGTIYYMTTSASTRFVVSTVGLISMSLSFRRFALIFTQ